MRHTLVLDQLVPVQVGHTVEVVLVGKSLALVRDRETGVEHVPSTLATTELGSSGYDASMYVEEVPPGRLGGTRLVGRVVACRVVTHADRADTCGFVTRLVIEDAAA